MIATVINALAIIGGSLIGLLVGRGIPERINETVIRGIALCVLMIGVLGIVGVASSLKAADTLVVIFSVALGGVVGEAIDIDKRIRGFGDAIEDRLKGWGGRISEGFVTASLVYCVGAMAIVGSLQSGLSGNHQTLYAKSVLDGISAIVFTSSLGAGVMLSSVSVFLYQGSITLAAGLLSGVLTTPTVNEMTAVGSALLMAIGLNMVGATNVKVANLLPAILAPTLYQLVLNLL